MTTMRFETTRGGENEMIEATLSDVLEALVDEMSAATFDPTTDPPADELRGAMEETR